MRKQLEQSIATLQQTLGDASVLSGVVRAGEITAQALLAGSKLMVAGNGGSAADSQHLVAEFVSRLTINRPALRAIALTTDSSVLTAIGNDYGYDIVFKRQIEALGQAGDVFLAISTSGNSKNILEALQFCRDRGITTIGFSGNGGGAMMELCDVNIIIPSTITMNIQECHLALEHIFCMIVERCYFGPAFSES